MYIFVAVFIYSSSFVQGLIIGPKCFGLKVWLYDLQTLEIPCPGGRIEVSDVLWGMRKGITREEGLEVCTSFTPSDVKTAENCRSSTVTRIVQNLCNGKSNCIISINDFRDASFKRNNDPCQDSSKFTTIDYECILPSKPSLTPTPTRVPKPTPRPTPKPTSKPTP